MVAARAVRDRFAQGLAQGELQFADVVEFSKARYNEEAKYLSKLRLYDILRAKDGWTDATALEALERNGFDRSTNLINIRRSPRLVATFAEIFDSPAERWRARPEPISGWPWMGKLTELIAQNGGVIPVELGGEQKTDHFVKKDDGLDPEIEELLSAAFTESDAEEEAEQEETFERDPLLAPASQPTQAQIDALLGDL